LQYQALQYTKGGSRMTKKHAKTKSYQKLQSDEKNLERKKKINFKIDKRKKAEEDIEDEWEEYQRNGYNSKD
jgi:hypothetical protein|tara:strand:+ start:78 stop:293 length:216 start_codon:yes stop_codon:yes gene_type:complete